MKFSPTDLLSMAHLFGINVENDTFEPFNIASLFNMYSKFYSTEVYQCLLFIY